MNCIIGWIFPILETNLTGGQFLIFGFYSETTLIIEKFHVVELIENTNIGGPID